MRIVVVFYNSGNLSKVMIKNKFYVILKVY